MRLLILILCCTAYSYGQTSSLELRGRIEAESQDIEGVVVQNLSKRVATVSASDGSFRISVSFGDTLLVKALSFKPIQWIFDESFKGVNDIVIAMEPLVNELEEVTVRPYNLSGEMTLDIQRLMLEPQLNAKELGLPNAGIYIPSKNERMLIEATSGSGFIPLNPLLNALTGRTKRLKNQVRLAKRNRMLEEVLKRYRQWLFVEHLDIVDSDVERFLYFCEADTVFSSIVQSKNELIFMEFLEAKSKEFKSIQ